METPDEDLATYMELNPTADAGEIARFVGDGMAMRFVEAVGSRSVSRTKQYKLALAVRRANTIATRLQSFARGRSVRRRFRLQATQRRDEDSRGVAGGMGGGSWLKNSAILGVKHISITRGASRDCMIMR